MQHNPDKQTQATGTDKGAIAENARALIAANADAPGEQVSEPRRRLAAALESGEEIFGRVREQAVAGAKVADQTFRKNPYQAIAIGIGVGAIIGYLMGRRCYSNCD
jgi:ElaB/YqjD/DUF883 family membrane-anchored ribosome-binding protein